MGWIHYNTEAGRCEACVTLPSELEGFHVVMKDHTWYDVIRNPYERQHRVNKFLDGLKDLLDTLAEKEPDIYYHKAYILHIDLTEDEKTALVSIQRTRAYAFICKNIPIPFV
ncbi:MULTISPECIES: hypothetical protein [Clostridia]|uniref:hypothetical protein n=1 Tax=Clostridia TaxID=186801 RepID=UPI000E4F68E5|nr:MULTISPECIES: hypothetical protein [Clostridia]MBU5447949.1 hypothetical protein [Blautia sp. MSJ-36]RHR70189.1 hypothetical protein DWW77_06250 [Ruminococcus sp. AF17-12]